MFKFSLAALLCDAIVFAWCCGMHTAAIKGKYRFAERAMEGGLAMTVLVFPVLACWFAVAWVYAP